MTKRHIDVTQEAGAAFFSQEIEGEVYMLNLLRFRATADYTASPELAPDTPISGAEAYKRYMKHAAPFLAESGGSVVFFGESGSFLIGPPDEHWDRVMLVRQQSLSDFLAFASNKAYQAILGHRIAALEDSRLLPIMPGTLTP